MWKFDMMMGYLNILTNMWFTDSFGRIWAKTTWKLKRSALLFLWSSHSIWVCIRNLYLKKSIFFHLNFKMNHFPCSLKSKYTESNLIFPLNQQQRWSRSMCYMFMTRKKFRFLSTKVFCVTLDESCFDGWI